MNGNQAEKTLMQRYEEKYDLSALSALDRDKLEGLVSASFAHRTKNFEKKWQRQNSLLSLRQTLWLYRNHHVQNHPGFLAILEGIESWMDLEFDSYKKGGIQP